MTCHRQLVSILLIFSLLNIVKNQTPELTTLLDRFLSTNCGQNQFDCGEKCIDVKRFHDCTVDCSNGVDEECWPGMVKCDGCRCVDARDADAVCIDRSGFNQKLCRTPTRTIYRCTNDNCILFKWISDGRNDCGDWSDENPCVLGYKQCPEDQRCRFTAPRTTVCECIDSTNSFNGTHCFAAPTTTPNPQTTAKPIGPTSNIPLPPKCADAVPSESGVSLASDPISLIYVLDSGVRMAADQELIAAATVKYVFRVVRDQPNQIRNYIFAPFREIVLPLSNTASPLLLVQSVQQQRFESGILCAKPLFSALQRALMAAETRSVALIFTDGNATDLMLFEQVIALATFKQIQINVVFTDENCECVCEPRHAAVESLIAYQRLTTLTHGVLFQIEKKSHQYNGVMQMVNGQIRALNLLVARSQNMDSTELKFPVDSGLDILYGTVTGSNVQLQWESPVPETMLLHSRNVKGFSSVSYVGSEITMLSNANGITSAQVSAVGWPEFNFGFSWNPFDQNSVFRERPWFGLPEYVLINYRPINFVNLTLSWVSISETETGVEVFSGVPVLYENSVEYQWIAGPFNPNCQYFEIKVMGENPCGEKFQRWSRSSIRAFEANVINRLPGSCQPNEFDCGNGLCVDANSYRNCRADCPDAIDEARPMDSYHCSGRFSGCGGFGNNTYKPLSQWCQKPYVFKCDNGYCIPYQWVNDGANDCGDGSDERENVTQTPFTTPFVQTTTPLVTTTEFYYNQTLEPPPDSFDLYISLFDNSCPTSGGPFFQCANGDCIGLEFFRDCRIHCSDGSDELCAYGMEKCTSCKCGLPSEKDIDCIDREVQALCDRRQMYACKSGHFCTLKSNLLDGIKHCPDGSDEDPSYLDECYLGLDRCAIHATCSNILGGAYRCICKFGYFGNGTHCALPHT